MRKLRLAGEPGEQRLGRSPESLFADLLYRASYLERRPPFRAGLFADFFATFRAGLGLVPPPFFPGLRVGAFLDSFFAGVFFAGLRGAVFLAAFFAGFFAAFFGAAFFAGFFGAAFFAAFFGAAFFAGLAAFAGFGLGLNLCGIARSTFATARPTVAATDSRVDG
jgi:hypothetical protein